MPRLRYSVLDISPVPPGGTATSAFRHSAELIAVAERAGYERFWVAEHHGIGYRNAGSSPEVLIAHLATLTSRIRVGSGAVLLDKYRPYKVASTFRVLHALFPGRVDLGVGRGSSPPPVEAALRAASDDDSDPLFAALAATTALLTYRDQLAELLAWLSHDFEPDHPYARYPLSPGTTGGPQPWLLGSSPASAVLAGQFGMRYCFAAFLNPGDAPSVLSIYRSAFRAAQPADAPAPCAMLAVSAACAPTDAAADELRAGAELHDRRIAARDPAVDLPLPAPARALAELGGSPPPAEVEPGRWPRHLSGSPGRLAAQLDLISAESGADELMICDLIGDHAARLRSYELLADALRPVPAG